jgi:hypothetical protein
VSLAPQPLSSSSAEVPVRVIRRRGRLVVFTSAGWYPAGRER